MKLHRSLLLAGLFLTPGCAGRAPEPSTASTISPAVERVALLSAGVSSTRSALDSTVLGIHRLSADTSAGSAARSRTLRRRAADLDSAYRAGVTELLVAVNASTAGVTAGTARFPIAAAPTPFLHGFSDGVNWMLRSPLVHHFGTNTSAVIIVPRGFVSDLASMPEALQILRGRGPSSRRYVIASLVHDYLYWRQDCTRAQADNIMMKAMLEEGVSGIERRLVYEGVRRFGQAAWDGNRRARQEGLIRTVAAPNDEIPPTATWAEYREWLRANRATEGFEYRVPAVVCRLGDSE